MTFSDEFQRRPMIATDAKGFGSADDQRQLAIQSGLRAVPEQAAERSGLCREGWDTQFTGDGELAVLPREAREAVVADEYVRAFAAELAHYNRDLRSEARLRVRMAIHFGNAVPSAEGYRGQGVVAVSRLVDSDVLRAALDVSGADLVVALSNQVFEDTVLQGYTTVSAEEFRGVNVREKEFVAQAWIRVPGHDIHALDLGSAIPARGRHRREAGQTPPPAPEKRPETLEAPDQSPATRGENDPDSAATVASTNVEEIRIDRSTGLSSGGIQPGRDQDSSPR
ncbi:hypothetical protein [Salinactinospora qingdaonensis]|uniref:Adenylate cyclase, class 3 n=1 Tax=Salinactinospora qingdaonensis TaxID=702744 RepID=A0ABP7FYM3_9ACTN